jgi:molybdate transport system substrate-binding protein
LAAVASGNVDAGIVYRTDVPQEPDVWSVRVVPHAEGPRIEYPVCIVRSAPAPEAAQVLLDFLAGQRAQEIFRRFGFLSVESVADP